MKIAVVCKVANLSILKMKVLVFVLLVGLVAAGSKKKGKSDLRSKRAGELNRKRQLISSFKTLINVLISSWKTHSLTTHSLARCLKKIECTGIKIWMR